MAAHNDLHGHRGADPTTDRKKVGATQGRSRALRETGGKNNNGAWVVGRVFSRGFLGLFAWFCRVGASALRCTVRVKNRWPRKVVARRTGRRAVEPGDERAKGGLGSVIE